MSHNVEQMMYLRQDGAPWHGLGTALDAPATWDEAVRTGGLDWEVTPRPVYYRTEDGSVPFREIPDRFALVRSTTGHTLGLVSGNYRPIQNRELFDFMDPLVADHEAVFRTAGVIGNGERVWALAKLADTIDVRDGDRLDFYLLLTAAHDGKHGADFTLTTVRVVCSNTFNQAYAEASRSARGIVKVRHTGDVKGKMQEAHRILNISREGIASIAADVGRLVAAKATPDITSRFLSGVFPTPEARKDERPDLFGARLGKVVALRNRALELASSGLGNGFGSLWDLTQGVTDVVDHELSVHSRKSALLYTQEGPGNVLKSNAFRVALALAA